MRDLLAAMLRGALRTSGWRDSAMGAPAVPVPSSPS